MSLATDAHTGGTPSRKDLKAVSGMPEQVQGACPSLDSGNALLGLVGAGSRTPNFSTTPFRKESASGDWVTVSGADSCATVLYLHRRRFQNDIPLDFFAPRLSKATGFCVLKANYSLAQDFPYPAKHENVPESTRHYWRCIASTWPG